MYVCCFCRSKKTNVQGAGCRRVGVDFVTAHTAFEASCCTYPAQQKVCLVHNVLIASSNRAKDALYVLIQLIPKSMGEK